MVFFFCQLLQHFLKRCNPSVLQCFASRTDSACCNTPRPYFRLFKDVSSSFPPSFSWNSIGCPYSLASPLCRSFVPTLCVSVHTVDPSACFPSHSPRLHQVFAPTGEFGGFSFFGGVLTTPAVLAAVLAFIRPLCVCVHACDAYVSFPSLCGSSGCDSGLLSDKFDFFWPFWGALTCSDCFQALASHSQHSARASKCSTRPLVFQASLARPCAVPRL